MPSSNAVQVAKAAAGKEALPGPSPRLQAQLSQLQKRPADFSPLTHARNSPCGGAAGKTPVSEGGVQAARWF